MKITCISKIKGHRVFDAFSWPAALPEFGRYNLIYGWNGSGKTTLSNLLRCLEVKEAILEGEVDFHLDGKVCSGASLGVANPLPQVRVFNRGFVEANVFATTQQLNPIFFLGKDSVEKQKQLEELNKTKLSEQQKLVTKNTAKSKATKALDDFCIREAKAIKDLLSSSGSNPYNNYDKSSFRTICTKLAKADPPLSPLTDQEKTLLKQQKDSTPKETIAAVSLNALDCNELREQTEKLLGRTVISQVLEELVAEAPVAEWVKQGLGHHTGKEHSEKCRFCGSGIPEGRITKLEAHFNDDYNQFLAELEAASIEIAENQKGLSVIQFPDKAKFYEHLVGDYVKSAGALRKYVEDCNTYLSQLAKALAQKRNKPFELVAFEAFMAGAQIPEGSNSSAIEAVNNLINRHNKETENFQNVVTEARKQLEEGLVREAVEDFKNKTEAIQTIATDLQTLQTTIKGLGEQTLALEKEIVEHRRPAEELNRELLSYIGRDELKFELFGSGYQIMRHGVPATNLSEGERTAITFLYFLKSLQAKGFTIANDIVVIDDPVSSLDANSLFCAFGYMKERTKDAGQLFIFTHNFAFFRQVKNWFNHLPHQGKKDIAQRPARFYMVEAGMASGKRNALLKELDPLLHQFESEYHYLFKKIQDETIVGGVKKSLEEFYGMPNIARRLLESFMAFRYPAQSGELKQQLDLVTFDPAKKARILRFLHTYSHDGKIAEPEHDLSVLAETPDVLKDVLEMLKAEDPKHFGEMVNLLSMTSS